MLLLVSYSVDQLAEPSNSQADNGRLNFMYKFLILAFSLNCFVLTAQSSQYVYTNDNFTNQIGHVALELQNGEILFSVNQFEVFGETRGAQLIVLDISGNLIRENTFFEEDLRLSIYSLIAFGDQIIAIGDQYDPFVSQARLWYMVLDQNLQVISERLHEIGNEDVFYSQAKIIEDQIQVIATVGDFWIPKLFILSLSGDLIFQKDDFSFSGYTNNIFYNPEREEYIIRSSKPQVLDEDFELTNTVNLPISVRQQGDMIRMDTTYLISGNNIAIDGTRSIGIAKFTQDFDLLASNIFGLENDTIDLAAPYKGIGYVNPEKIYCGGTSNFQVIPPSPYGNIPSWFNLAQMDSDLNTTWNKTYGGDAYYTLWGILATSDEGCAMYGFRHDYQNAPGKLELYILKVNADGEVTGTTQLPINDPNWRIYPNPCQEKLWISADEAAIQNVATIRLSDLNGRVIMQKQVNGLNDQIEIELPGLPAGTYILNLYNTNKQLIGVERVIKI